MKFLHCFYFILLLSNSICDQFLLPPTNLDKYDAYGSLLAVNEYLSIIAQNDQKQFKIITNPFTNQSKKYTLPYEMIQHHMNSSTHFVYNIAIGIKQNASQLFFSYIDENEKRDVFLTIVFLKFTNPNYVQLVNHIAINMTDLDMQEHGLVGMDAYGKRAYAMGVYRIICVEIETSYRWFLDTENLFENKSKIKKLFFPKQFVITEDYYIFTVGQKSTNNLQFLPYLLVLNILLPSNIILLSETQLSDYNFGPFSIDITHDSIMSIAFLDHIEQFIIGIPCQDMIIVLSWNKTLPYRAPVIIRKYNSPQTGVLFGKSLALLENNTYAVLAHTLSTAPWSRSQVQIYSLDNNEENNHPLMIYPNNQQIIPLINYKPLPYSILTIMSWKSYLGLVFDAGAALLLSTSPPGYYSIQTNKLSDISVSISALCIPGTARNTTSIGPCLLCPSGTKNNGTSGIQCEPCETDASLLCLRGALVEIDSTNVMNYDQALPYPQSPDLVEFDDILMHNIFSFPNQSFHCLIISPLFWTLISAGFGFLILIIMYILICFPRCRPHRTRMKKLLTHIDLISEGELWLGGLVTFTIIVLIVFTCKFSISFTHLYPIERILSDITTTDSCHSQLPNVKFSSDLQPIAIIQHEIEKPIFKMFEEQNLILSMEFVSTGFSCQNVEMKRNFLREHRLESKNFNCSFNTETSILSVSTVLPQHTITVQFDLIGPYFVGGLRLCLRGPFRTEDNGKYILQELQFCQFLYTDNQTLTVNPTISIKMTKVINRTMGYTISDDINYSGIWIPILAVEPLTDSVFFDKNGEFSRYLSDRITLLVDITEAEFFMRNTQEPIARNSEILLHTILIGIVFLELFSLGFLLVKLTIEPPVKLLRQRFFAKQNQHKDEHLIQLIQLTVEEVLRKQKIIKNHSDNDLDIPLRTIY